MSGSDEKLKRKEQLHLDFEYDPFTGGESLSPWQAKVNEVIFGVDTPGGKLFDVLLLIAISISVLTVILESVQEFRLQFGMLFFALEITFTLLFTIEYIVRLLCVEKPTRYALSFYGVVDILSILPTYLSLFIGGSQSLIVIRALRLLRIFRVLKIAHCLKEAHYLWLAFRATFNKITVFLVVVMTLILIMGSAMYLIEGPKSGFDNIPISIYWAVVTMTTVGYGDIAPQTITGRTLAAIAMILGYGIIIVPTGIFSVEVISANRPEKRREIPCIHCQHSSHEQDAKFCKSCGHKLPTVV